MNLVKLEGNAYKLIYFIWFLSTALNLRRLETRIGISCVIPGLAGHLLGQFTWMETKKGRVSMISGLPVVSRYTFHIIVKWALTYFYSPN